MLGFQAYILAHIYIAFFSLPAVLRRPSEGNATVAELPANALMVTARKFAAIHRRTTKWFNLFSGQFFPGSSRGFSNFVDSRPNIRGEN